MRTLLKLILSMALLAMVSCEEQLPEPIAVTSVSLNAETVEMAEGDELTLIATVSPKNADNKSLIWSSSNLSIASVDNGKVRAHKQGKATITVKTDDGGKTATCDVIVTAKSYSVTGITLDKTSATLTEGEELTLTATINPSNATNKDVTWSSSDNTVASVSNGKVTALNAGKATITVKTDDGEKTAKCDILVVESKKATSLTLSDSYMNCFIYKSQSKHYSVSVAVYPSDAVTEYEWTSSDTRVAKVVGEDDEAVIYTEDYGVSTITVYDKRSGCSASMTIHTILDSFSFNMESEEFYGQYPLINVYIDETYQLTYSHSPSHATKLFSDLSKFKFYEDNKRVIEPTLISIDENGLITGKKTGLIRIEPANIAYNISGGLYVRIIEKEVPITGISLDRTSATLTEGEELTLTASLMPDNATNKNLTWSSSNSSVASVVNGKVTALKAGYAIISAKTEDGNMTANCDITVVEPPKATSLSLSESFINGYIYRDHSKIYRVSVTAYPSNAVTDYEWNSSDTRVAKVEGNGDSAEIYTEDYGESTITVTDRRTGISSSMTIHTLVEDFAWNESTSETMYGYPMITVYLNEEYKLNYSYSPSYATKIFSDLSQFVFYEDNYVVDTPTVISVSEDGVVTGHKVGVVGIKPTGLILKTAETDRLYIKVKERYTPVTGVTLDKTSATLTEGDELTLTATVNPDNATNKNVTWSSSDNTVASVSNGKVTALKAGKATVTVKTEDGNKIAICEVTVNAKVYPIEKIILDKTYVEVKVSNEITLTATIYPSNASNKTLKWTSSDTSVATVYNGKVTPLKAGQVVIKATSEEYNISAICDVKVLADGPGGSNESIGGNEGIW